MSFADQMLAFATKTTKRLSKTVIEFNRLITWEIVDSTPYGDPSIWKNSPPSDYVPGTLKANWYASKSKPSKKYSKRVKEEDSNRILQREKARIDESAGGKYYLTNNSPYAHRIEYAGWSRQAPSGMVRVAIRNANNLMKRAVQHSRRV